MFTHKSARPRRRVFLIAAVAHSWRSFHSALAALREPTARLTGLLRPTIVLVHGDWADASSWTKVIERLQDKGFTVVAPPNLLRGPATDAPYLASYLRTISGPIVLVAHSYGGFVATNAATGIANVKALVYIDAFMPDEGETAGALVASSDSCIVDDGLNFRCLTTVDWISTSAGKRTRRTPGYRECFANGVAPKDAAVLWAGQRPAARGPVLRALGASGVEDDPVLVADRDVGQRDPACTTGRDVQPGRRSDLEGRCRPLLAHHPPCCRDQGDPRRRRCDEVIRPIEVAATGSELHAATSRLIHRPTRPA